MRIRGRLLLARGYRISPIRRGRERQLPWQRQDRGHARLVGSHASISALGRRNAEATARGHAESVFRHFRFGDLSSSPGEGFSPSLSTIYFLLSIACLSESWLPAAPLIRITTRRPASFTSRTRTWLKCS